MAASDTRLVKLYHCVGEAWNDCGTGHVTVQYSQAGAKLEVRSDSDGGSADMSPMCVCFLSDTNANSGSHGVL
jgi:hypothetical protein